MHRWLRLGMQLIVLVAVFSLGVAICLYVYLSPKLPSVESLRGVQYQVPLKVFAADGSLIGEFGEQKRIPIPIAQAPPLLIKAILAAEDDRFYHHSGVDYEGLIRAAWQLIRTGEKRQGGSTITMQVARNFFLSREKTFLRKSMEVLLAFKIERALGKDEILNLYINKIFLGHRSYGFAAAAQTYYGKQLKDLDLSQLATLAGVPKAPSLFNPVSGPEQAMIRRNYVLSRMYELKFLSQEELREGLRYPINAQLHEFEIGFDAQHAAEWVRGEMVERFGTAAYTDGFEVTTTIDPQLQRLANQAVRNGLRAYDRRHGYRGAEKKITAAFLSNKASVKALLQGIPEYGGLRAAVVTDVHKDHAELATARGMARLDLASVRWARPFINEERMGPEPALVSAVLSRGDLVRITNTPEGSLELAQLPAVEGAMVVLSPADGAIKALVGGFDFQQSHFNRITQADRQPGSSFKPCVYAAALSKGYTSASIVNDAPLVLDGGALTEKWRPENYSGKFHGPTPLRDALANSRNLVAIRLLQDIGIDYGRDYCLRFGYPAHKIPRNLSLALGSGAITPLESARSFAVFANGGFLVSPYIITTILKQEGTVVFQAEPALACEEGCPMEQKGMQLSRPEDIEVIELLEMVKSGDNMSNRAERVLPATDAYIMHSLLKDVIRIGTARRALSLGRSDIAGKTGTTNNQKDAWFSGYIPDLAATVWVGFDQPRSLGKLETGGRTALPIWVDFMANALRNVPEQEPALPTGLVTVRIDPLTGETASADTPNAIFEIFRADYAPGPGTTKTEVQGGGAEGSQRVVLF